MTRKPGARVGVGRGRLMRVGGCGFSVWYKFSQIKIKLFHAWTRVGTLLESSG